MQKDKEMPSKLRFKPLETELLRKKSIELNKILIGNEQKPVTESELAHIVLELAIKKLKVEKNGNFYIDL